MAPPGASGAGWARALHSPDGRARSRFVQVRVGIIPPVLTGGTRMRIQNWSKVGALVVGIAITLPACTTIDAYTREEETSHAQRQAVIGAAAGAVAGLITGDDSMERKKRALAGAGVGTYMDRQEAKLRAELERTGVSVTRVGDNITLNMPGNITFAFGSAD